MVQFMLWHFMKSIVFFIVARERGNVTAFNDARDLWLKGVLKHSVDISKKSLFLSAHRSHCWLMSNGYPLDHSDIRRSLRLGKCLGDNPRVETRGYE